MSKPEKVKAVASAVAHGKNPRKAAPVASQGTSLRSGGSDGRVATPTIDIPTQTFTRENNGKLSPKTPKTPKTPADEGIEFFESVAKKGTPIQVYELKLDPDGGPSKDKSVGSNSFSFCPFVVVVVVAQFCHANFRHTLVVYSPPARLCPVRPTC